MGTAALPSWAAVDAAISAGSGAALSFLERLIAEPSTVGEEQAAQELVAAELVGLGFGVSWLEIPAETAARTPGGVAQASYQGRRNVLGRINSGMSPSLLLDGHIDVVPAEAAVWSSDPFTATRSDGWLTGRGAGDMKAGFAMGLLAVRALRDALPEAVTGEPAFLSAGWRWPTGRRHGTSTRRTRRSRSPASRRARGRWRGSSPGSSRAAACRLMVVRAMASRPPAVRAVVSRQTVIRAVVSRPTAVRAVASQP